MLAFGDVVGAGRSARAERARGGEVRGRGTRRQAPGACLVLGDAAGLHDVLDVLALAHGVDAGALGLDALEDLAVALRGPEGESEERFFEPQAMPETPAVMWGKIRHALYKERRLGSVRH